MTGRSRGAERPLLVELAGVAGAGKSTLARSLTAPGRLGPLADTLRTSDPRHLAAVIRGAPAAIRAVVGGLVDGRPLRWVEVKLVLYLAGFDPATTAAGHDWLVVDQGPVYSFARLAARGAPRGAAIGGRRWSRWLARWAARLDLVVLLDAPTATLLARIDDRTQAHEVKRADPVAATAFVTGFRAAYEQVVTALERRDVAVVRIDTASLDPDEVHERVVGAAAAVTTGRVGG